MSEEKVVEEFLVFCQNVDGKNFFIYTTVKSTIIDLLSEAIAEFCKDRCNLPNASAIVPVVELLVKNSTKSSVVKDFKDFDETQENSTVVSYFVGEDGYVNININKNHSVWEIFPFV